MDIRVEYLMLFNGPVAQLVRALPCHGRGQGFKSPSGRDRRSCPSKYRRIFIRFYKTYGWVPEWPKGADCKSVSIAFGGPNPPPSNLMGC